MLKNRPSLNKKAYMSSEKKTWLFGVKKGGIMLPSIVCHGNLEATPPPRIEVLIRPYSGKPMVNSPLIRLYFLGGVALGAGALRFP